MITWYSRAPITPAITTHTMMSLSCFAGWPRRTQRTSDTLTAINTPMASISPYMCSGSGPRWTMLSLGLGMKPRGGAGITAQL